MKDLIVSDEPGQIEIHALNSHYFKEGSEPELEIVIPACKYYRPASNSLGCSEVWNLGLDSQKRSGGLVKRDLDYKKINGRSRGCSIV